MRHKFAFGAATLIIGWLLQIFIIGIIPVGWPSPHLLLVIVLALAGRGEINLAQSVGFFWGLALDIQGVSLFGCQGWLLALTGYCVGRISRQLNIEKPMTQMAAAGVVSLLFWGGLSLIDGLFRSVQPERPLFPDVMLLGVLYDVLFAPLVFRLAKWWMVFWIEFENSSFIGSGKRHVG